MNQSEDNVELISKILEKKLFVCEHCGQDNSIKIYYMVSGFSRVLIGTISGGEFDFHAGFLQSNTPPIITKIICTGCGEPLSELDLRLLNTYKKTHYKYKNITRDVSYLVEIWTHLNAQNAEKASTSSTS